jgi:hypothetical protein
MGPHVRPVDRWEGLADPDTAVLERPVAQAEWRAPCGVELDDERDCLLYPMNRAHERRIRAGAGLLEGFISLADAPPQVIRNFARRWGVLALCRHGLPMSHNGVRSNPDKQEIASWGCAPILADGGWDTLLEPLEPWRRLSGAARGMLNVGASLRDGRPGTISDWRSIDGAFFKAAVLYTVRTGRDLPPVDSRETWRALLEQVPLGRDVEFDRAVLGQLLNDGLRMGMARPFIDWDEQSPRITLAGDGLFGALAVQLLFAASSARGLATCTFCGQPYVPTRRPRSDQRRFCPSCRRNGVPRRMAKRDFDRRHRRQGAEAEY